MAAPFPSVSLKEFVELIEARIPGGKMGVSVLLTLLLFAGIIAALAAIIASCSYVYSHVIVGLLAALTSLAGASHTSNFAAIAEAVLRVLATIVFMYIIFEIISIL